MLDAKSLSLSRNLVEYQNLDNTRDFDYMMQKMQHKSRYDDYLK